MFINNYKYIVYKQYLQMFINISNACAMQKDHYENSIMYLHVEIVFNQRNESFCLFLQFILWEKRVIKYDMKEHNVILAMRKQSHWKPPSFLFHSRTELNHTLLDLCLTRFYDQRSFVAFYKSTLWESMNIFLIILNPLICEPQTTFSVPR